MYFCFLLFPLFEISPLLNSCAFRRAQVIAHAYYTDTLVQLYSIFRVFPFARLGKAQVIVIVNSMTMQLYGQSYLFLKYY